MALLLNTKNSRMGEEIINAYVGIRNAFKEGYNGAFKAELYPAITYADFMPHTNECCEIPKTCFGLLMVRDWMPEHYVHIFITRLREVKDNQSLSLWQAMIYSFMCGYLYGYRVSILYKDQEKHCNEMDLIKAMAIRSCENSFTRNAEDGKNASKHNIFDDLVGVPQELVPEGDIRMAAFDTIVNVYEGGMWAVLCSCTNDNLYDDYVFEQPVFDYVSDLDVENIK